LAHLALGHFEQQPLETGEGMDEMYRRQELEANARARAWGFACALLARKDAVHRRETVKHEDWPRGRRLKAVPKQRKG
jgi:hypothetical protein